MSSNDSIQGGALMSTTALVRPAGPVKRKTPLTQWVLACEAADVYVCSRTEKAAKELVLQLYLGDKLVIPVEATRVRPVKAGPVMKWVAPCVRWNGLIWVAKVAPNGAFTLNTPGTRQQAEEAYAAWKGGPCGPEYRLGSLDAGGLVWKPMRTTYNYTGD